jgi:hypothetical protein
MFKLVVLPLDDGTYKVINLDAYYAEGTSYDITKYVDLKKWDVNRGKIFSEISFKFQEPTTKGNILYEQINGRAFGDEELTLREDPDDETSEQLDGESFTFELPFEQVIFERLYDNGDGIATNLVYGNITDEAGEPVNPKPVIFYNSNTYTGSKTIGFQDDLGGKTQILTWNNPLHGELRDNPQYSTTFSKEQNIWNFNYLSKNLYTNHFETYITDTFNIKKREYKYTVYLPLSIAVKLELNDLVIIKGSYYRIQKYSYNIMTGKAVFDLINYFGATDPTALNSSNQQVSTDFEAKSLLIYVFNLDGATYNKVDVSGDGTSWVSSVENPATETGILSLDFTEHSSGFNIRSLFLDITNNGQTLRVTIKQTPQTSILTSDNNFITSDNNFYTSDNNG